MGFGNWLVVLCLSLSAVAHEGQVRFPVVLDLTHDFTRWSAVRGDRMTELLSSLPESERQKRAKGIFEQFLVSPGNKQKHLKPTREEILAVLENLIASRYPFHFDQFEMPVWERLSPEVTKTRSPRLASLHLSSVKWYLPQPERVVRDRMGNPDLSRGRPYVNGALNLKYATESPFDPAHYYFDSREPLTVNLQKKIYSREDFELVLQILSHLETGRVLLDAVAEYVLIGNTVSPIPFLEMGTFEIKEGLSQPDEKVEKIRPKPVTSINFGTPNYIHFAPGAELGEALFDFVFSVVHDWPSSLGRIHSYGLLMDSVSGLDFYRQEEAAEQIQDASEKSLELRKIYYRRQHWQEKVRFSVFEEAWETQHQIFLELTELTKKITGGLNRELFIRYLKEKEMAGEMAPVTRMPDHRQIVESLSLETLREDPLVENECLRRLSRMEKKSTNREGLSYLTF